jgi:hypothetical protein
LQPLKKIYKIINIFIIGKICPSDQTLPHNQKASQDGEPVLSDRRSVIKQLQTPIITNKPKKPPRHLRGALGFAKGEAALLPLGTFVFFTKE